MENVGFTRKIDNLGRIVIPREYRKILNIKDYEFYSIKDLDNIFKVLQDK